MHDYIRLIVMKNLPMSNVADKEFLRLSKHAVLISKIKICEVIQQIVELVEKRIALKRKGTKDSVMYYG